MNVTSVINITDAMMIAMSVPNIIAMYILAPEVKKDLKAYCQKYKVGKLVNKKWIEEAELAKVPAVVAETIVEEKEIGDSKCQIK